MRTSHMEYVSATSLVRNTSGSKGSTPTEPPGRFGFGGVPVLLGLPSVNGRGFQSGVDINHGNIMNGEMNPHEHW